MVISSNKMIQQQLALKDQRSGGGNRNKRALLQRSTSTENEARA